MRFVKNISIFKVAFLFILAPLFSTNLLAQTGYECDNPNTIKPKFQFDLEPYKYDQSITVTLPYDASCTALSRHSSYIYLQSAPVDLKGTEWSFRIPLVGGNIPVRLDHFDTHINGYYPPKFIDGTYSGYIKTTIYVIENGRGSNYTKFTPFSFTLGSGGSGNDGNQTDTNAAPEIIVNGIPSQSVRSNLKDGFTFYAVATDDRGIKSLKITGFNRTYYDLEYTNPTRAPKTLNRNAYVVPGLIAEGESTRLTFTVTDSYGKSTSKSYTFTRAVTQTPPDEVEDSAPTIKLEGLPEGATSEDFLLSVNISAPAKLKSAQIYIDNKLTYTTSFPSPTHGGLVFIRKISIEGLQNGVHQLNVIALDYKDRQTNEAKAFATYLAPNGGGDSDSGGGDGGNDTGNDNGDDTDTGKNPNDDTTNDNSGNDNTSDNDASDNTDATENDLLESLLINLSELLNQLLVVLNDSNDTQKKAATTGLIEASAQMIYQVSHLVVALDAGATSKSTRMSGQLSDADVLSSAFADIMKQHKTELQSLDPKLRRMPRLTRRLARFAGKLLKVKKSKRKQKVLKKVKRTVKKIKRLSKD